MGIDEGLEVLARLESGDREQVRGPKIRSWTIRAKLVPRGRVRDVHAILANAEHSRYVLARVRGVDEHDVTRLRGVPVLAPVHRARP